MNKFTTSLDIIAIIVLYIALASQAGALGLSETGQMIMWFIAAPAGALISYGIIYATVCVAYGVTQEGNDDE